MSSSPPNMVIADTGFWLALAHRNDRYHALANERLRDLREPLVTTWRRILSTDARDFRTYRWKHREPFENVLLGAGGE